MKIQDRKYTRVNTRIKACMRRTVYDDSLFLFSSTLAGDTDDHAVKNLCGSRLPREIIHFLQQKDEKGDHDLKSHQPGKARTVRIPGTKRAYPGQKE